MTTQTISNYHDQQPSHFVTLTPCLWNHFASLLIMKTYHSHLISLTFIISFITTVTIHHSFSLPLQALNPSFPQILSSIVLPPFHPPDWLHGLQLFFFVFSGMSVSLVLCARLSWPLDSFQVHIKSEQLIIIIIIIIIIICLSVFNTVAIKKRVKLWKRIHLYLAVTLVQWKWENSGRMCSCMQGCGVLNFCGTLTPTTALKT